MFGDGEPGEHAARAEAGRRPFHLRSHGARSLTRRRDLLYRRTPSKAGSFDQRGVEARADVLVYTSDSTGRGSVDVTGPVEVTLYVSSDARDTDFTVKLIDVYPDGRAYNH